MASFDELIAFNKEVASLSHAGIPIDLGLSQLSSDPDIANRRINEALTERVESGVSLVDAVSDEAQSLPPIYQSVVGAGLRCGRLPAALEALSRYTQPLLDVGHSLRSALIYPLIICGLAYLLFVASCLFVPPESYQQMADLGAGASAVFHVVQTLRDSLPFWAPIPPVLLIVLLLVGFRSNGSRTTWLRGLPRLFSWFPGVSRVTADQRCASLAELLALLVEHEIPLHEALRLAAQASGDHELTSAAAQMANAAEQERSPAPDADEARQFPPFLRWAITSPTEAGDLVRTLRIASQTYRHRAERRIKWIRTVAPMMTCVVVAGGVTLLYCLSIFVPFVQLMKELH